MTRWRIYFQSKAIKGVSKARKCMEGEEEKNKREGREEEKQKGIKEEESFLRGWWIEVDREWAGRKFNAFRNNDSF